jgi:hypothetical protein
MERLRRHILVCILLLPGILCTAQTASFNLFNFTEPQNWKKEERKGLLIYTDINNAEGYYGQIGLYTSRESSNDPVSEFRNDWNSLISGHYTVPANPEIKVTVLDPYWKVAQTTVPASLNGQNFTLQMVNYTGIDKSATIIASFNSDSYKRKIEEFILSVKMDGPDGKPEQVQTVAASVSPVAVTGGGKVLSDTPVNTTKSQTYSNLIFRLPSGWQRQVKGNFLSVFPSGLKQGEALEIRVLQPLNTADYTAASASTWTEMGQKWQDEIRDDIFAGRSHTTALGWNYFSEKKHTRRQSGIDTEFELFLIANGSIMERVIIISEEFRAEGMLYSTSTRFFDDIYNFVFSIRLSGKPGEGSVIPMISGGPITGVWTGISGGFSGISGTYDQKAFYAVFYNSGIAYFRDRLPDRGLYQHNPLVWQYVYPSYWCTYNISGNQGVMENKYYNTIPFVLAGDKLTITKNGLDHSYSKLSSPDGMRFKGTWAFGSGESLTLNPDGSFTDMGALGIIEHSLYYKPYTVTISQGTGRYEIRDFTAIFTYSDGRVFRCSFPGFDIDRNTPSPPLIIFGRDDVLRLK